LNVQGREDLRNLLQIAFFIRLGVKM
jgi:hypothetical protein